MLQRDAVSPAVVVHGAADIARACAPGLPLILLSAEGAAIFAGPTWWLALVRHAQARFGALITADILDCADAPGLALAALRCGQHTLILDRACPAFATVSAAAATIGAIILPTRPPALDLAAPNAERRLHAWLHDKAPKLR